MGRQVHTEGDPEERPVDSALSLLLAMEAARIGAFEVDFVDGSDVGFNPAAREIFGFAPDVPINAEMVEALVHEDDRAERVRARKAAVDPNGDGAYRATYRIRRAHDGALRWISAHGQAFCEGGRVRLVGVSRDITDEINAAWILREKAALNDERLSTLESMAAGLAHEVNQPLAAGATFLKVARRMLDARGYAAREESAAEVLRLLDKASAQIVRAGRIITRVREFSTRGEPDKTYQNLHQLIAGVGNAMSEDEKLANFRLLMRLNAENDRVIVDRMQISQVLVNLIRNAAQAMHGSPTHDIIVATALDTRNDIRVQVIDRGVGLTEETHKGLFEPFKTSKPSGMGVGLSISRAIVEAHFGKIWAEPNPGGGAIFSFSLPLAEQVLP